MKIRLGDLRRLIREEAWVPGHYYPGAEPLDGEDRDRINQPLGEEDEDELEEVYLDENPVGAGMGADPTKSDDKPYRNEDPYEQLGMHPKATAAGSPPDVGGGGEASPAEPADEPTEGT